MRRASMASRWSLWWVSMLLLIFAPINYVVAQTCVEPPAGIIAWWTFDATSGTTAQDIGGNNDGIHVNDPTPALGLVDGALRFDGTNDYVGVQDSDLWAFGSNDFTIEFWANFDVPGGGSIGHPGDVFISSNDGGGTQNKWFFALGGGNLNFHINGPTVGSRFFPLVPFSPTVGEWYHLAVTRDSDTYTIFIDGVPSGSEVDTRIIPNANAPLTIGQSNEAFGGFMNGFLDEMTVYHRALSEAEILAIANAGDAGKCKGIAIETEALSAVKLGESFSQTLKAIFGVPPLTWSITNGLLPDGVTLSSNGTLSGTSPEAGEFNITVRVEDSTGDFDEKPFTLKVLVTLPPPEIHLSKTGTLAVPGRTIDYFILVENLGIVDAEEVRISEIPQPNSAFSIETASPEPTFAFKEFIIWDLPRISPGQIQLLSYQATLSPTVPIGETVIGRAQETCPACEATDECRSIATFCTIGGCDPLFGCDSAASGCIAAAKACEQRCRDLCANSGQAEDIQVTSGPVDPNEKVVVSNRFIQPDQLLVYPIHFENIGDVEAIDVFVTDILDSNLDASTLEILTSDGASFNSSTRTLRWELLGRNLQPGETGNVLFSIRPKSGLSSGTEIRNKAEIQFEIFDPLVTPEVVNIIDSTSPSCTMDSLPEETTNPEFSISWNGTDTVGEIDTYSIFVSEDGVGYTPFLQRTSVTNTTFNGEVGKTYRFICIATDTAGNTEEQDPVAEAITGVREPPVIEVAIDIKPGSDPNSINPNSKGVISVAILTTNGFDATTVDPLSVRFGLDGAAETHGRGHIEDADGDGDDDMVLHFRTQETGLQCGDTEAGLTGVTVDGQEIEGSDSIQTVGCE